ncbi:MAG: hypothetical protein ABI605_05140 [Rhizobacter sp.]
MIDRIFAPFLTFVMLIAGTAAIASSLFAQPSREVLVAQAAAPVPVRLETVVVTGRRKQAEPQVGHNEKTLAASASAVAEGRGVLLHRAQD